MKERKLHALDMGMPQLQKALKHEPETSWQERGETMALILFHQMAARVPAYQDFLKQHHIRPESIKTMEDFAKVPLIDKDNYLRKYPRADLCWDGEFGRGQWTISTTSGSTGEPFYFPRTDIQDEHYALTAELYLRENFHIDQKTTLYIDAFAMGAWLGGVFTYDAIKRVARKGYALSVITPGINKAEVINNVRNLGADFDQVIIGCYPPMLKDIIDLGEEEGIDWGKYNVGVIFSAEGFSEEFRDYIFKHAALPNMYTSTLNHYGTVDLGTMSHETPLSILARRQALEKPALFEVLFGNHRKQPTFTQYIPEMFYFEAVAGHVVCSAYGGLPLVRYDLKDNGGVMTLAELSAAYQGVGLDLDAELQKAGIADTKWNVPFVYLYERSDFSVTFCGAQIYPEEIRRALLASDLHDKVTGKFTMSTSYDKQARNHLDINVELRKGIPAMPELGTQITDHIVAGLLKDNSEYRVLYGEDSVKLRPRIKLWPYADPLYFHGNGKQKWVEKVPAQP